MALTYTIKNFKTVENKKLVGLTVIDENGNSFLVDKEIDLQEGKTNEEYISEAIELAQEQIQEWEENTSLLGRTFDPKSGKLQ